MSTFIQFIHIFKKCINISTFFFYKTAIVDPLFKAAGWVGFSSNAYSSHYLAPLVPQGRGKKGWYGCNVELSLITRVLISRAHLVDANSRIITEGDQLRFHPCKNTPFHLLDVQKVGIKYVSRVEKMQCR